MKLKQFLAMTKEENERMFVTRSKCVSCSSSAHHAGKGKEGPLCRDCWWERFGEDDEDKKR